MTSDGVNLWFVGSFLSVGAQPRMSIAGVRVSDGAVLDPWVDHNSCDGWVYNCLLVGQNLYVGGSFSRLGGGSPITRYRLAALDATTGAVQGAWDVPLSIEEPSSSTYYYRNAWGLAYGEGRLYVAGDFISAAGVSRGNFCAISEAAGTLLPENPGLNGPAYGLSLHGDRLIATGNFSVAGAAARQRAVEFSGLSGTVAPFSIPFNNSMGRSIVDPATVILVGNASSPRSYLYAYQNGALVSQCVLSPTSTRTRTSTMTWTQTRTPTASPSATVTATPSPSVSPSETPTLSATPSLSATGSPSASPTPSQTGTAVSTPPPTRLVPPEANTVLAFPNPYSLSWSKPLKFRFMPVENASLTVYGYSGRKVCDLPRSCLQADQGLAAWDLRDSSGQRLKPGPYFVVLRSSAQTARGKFTVLP